MARAEVSSVSTLSGRHLWVFNNQPCVGEDRYGIWYSQRLWMDKAWF